MSTITIPNIRVSSDLEIRLKLKDGGVAIDWSDLTNIKASIYSDRQRSLAGSCDIEIDGEDSTILVCRYSANKPQYPGVNRVIVCCTYDGETKTYDKPAFTFVRWTDDQAGQSITIDDPDIDVEITVEDISSSILQEAVEAAFSAAERADEAAAAAEHMVDIHQGPAGPAGADGSDGKSAYEIAVEEGFEGTEAEWLESLVGPQGPQGIQGEQGEQGPPGVSEANATIDGNTGVPSVEVSLNSGVLSFAFHNLKGLQGNPGSSVDYAFTLANNLTTDDSTVALTAAMGKMLKDLIDSLDTNDGVVLSRSLAEKMAPSPKIYTGGYYNKNGVFYSENSSYYTNLERIPPGATTLYYRGRAYGSADGGIIWYDSTKTRIGYHSTPGTGVEVAEISILSGAVYYKASSFKTGLNVEFDNTVLVSKNIEKIKEIEPLRKLVNSVLAGNFTYNPVNVTIPASVSGGTELGSLTLTKWLQQMYNAWPIAVTSLKFKAKNAADSFVVFVADSVSRTANTCRLVRKYTISASVVVGDNTIDVSSYGIVIPAEGAIYVSSAEYYGNSVDGKHRLIGIPATTSLLTIETITSALNYSIVLSVVGVEQRYDISVPASALSAVTAGNILFGKSYVALGDSFTDSVGISDTIPDGPYAGYKKVYPYIIANRNYMTVLNQGESGGTLNRYIVNSKFNSILADVDYVTIWYGINDNAAGISIGDVTDMPETQISSVTDTSTCGAFNWMLKWLFTNRPQTKIGVIITDYCEQARREAIIGVCQRWGVAYLDLYNPVVPMIKTRGNSFGNPTPAVCSDALSLRAAWANIGPSNIHPTPACHEWQSSIVEHFMRGL